MAAPFQCLVPYDLFSIQLRELDVLRAPAEMLRHVERSIDSAARRRMRLFLLHFRRDLLCDYPNGSRVAENVLLTAARSHVPQSATGEACCALPDRTCVAEPLGHLTRGKRPKCPQQARADRILAATRCIRPSSCHSATSATINWIDANAVVKEKHCASGEIRAASSCRVKIPNLPRDGPVDRQVGPAEVSRLQTRAGQLVNVSHF